MAKSRVILRKFSGFLIVCLLATGCGDDSSEKEESAPRNSTVISVDYGPFGETRILSEMFIQVLSHRGYPVESYRKLGLREVYEPAVESGEIDIIPEYLGSLLAFFGGEPTNDAAETNRRLQEHLEERGLLIPGYSPAGNTNGFIVTAATSEKYGLTKVSDLIPVAGELSLAGPENCPKNRYCLLGLKDVYGIEFKEFQVLDVGGPLTVAALDTGIVDVGVLFATDNLIAEKNFRFLIDDRGLQPAENFTALVNEDVVDQYGGGVLEALNAVLSRLDNGEMMELNSQLAGDNQKAGEVARTWLEKEGLLDKE